MGCANSHANSVKSIDDSTRTKQLVRENQNTLLNCETKEAKNVISNLMNSAREKGIDLSKLDNNWRKEGHYLDLLMMKDIANLNIQNLHSLLYYKKSLKLDHDKELLMYKNKLIDLIASREDNKFHPSYAYNLIADDIEYMNSDKSIDHEINWTLFMIKTITKSNLNELPRCTCFTFKLNRIHSHDYCRFNKMERYQSIQENLDESKVCDVPSFFMSHRWRTKDDPDPTSLDTQYYNKILVSILSLITHAVKESTVIDYTWVLEVLIKLKVCALHVNSHLITYINEIGLLTKSNTSIKNMRCPFHLWYDYCCLPQWNRLSHLAVNFRMHNSAHLVHGRCRTSDRELA